MQVPWRDRRGRFLWLKAVVLPALFVPGLLYAVWLATDQLGGRPVMETIHGTGLWTIRLLLVSLAITPFARALEWPDLLLVRRMVGVSAACYAVAHLTLYVVDQNFRFGTVVSEIALRFYLTIGFVALLGLLALAGTSTDAAMQRLGRNWKRLHRLAYPIGVIALLHYFIQSKLKVSEPVFVTGLFLWLMLWRALPEGWQRSRNFSLAAGLYAGLAGLSALATAAVEVAWYGLATKVDPWRVLAANETLARGLRPAHWVFVVTLGIAVVVLTRRAWPMLRRPQKAVV
ncbi:MAG: ferric reductase-like transmembrane domain-containing protein [Acetobacteraceae bacterium]